MIRSGDPIRDPIHICPRHSGTQGLFFRLDKDNDGKDNDDGGSENVGKKSEFAFFQTLSRQFGPAQYVKCRRLFLELNSLKRILFRLKKRKENSSSYIHVLHKTAN